VIGVSNLQRTEASYEDELGLAGTQTPGGWMVRVDAGTVCHLLPSVPDAGSASWPVAGLRVADVHAKVRELRSQGVPFLGPDDLPFPLDDDGVSSDQTGMQSPGCATRTEMSRPCSPSTLNPGSVRPSDSATKLEGVSQVTESRRSSGRRRPIASPSRRGIPLRDTGTGLLRPLERRRSRFALRNSAGGRRWISREASGP
jgi:hypothetical protein